MPELKPHLTDSDRSQEGKEVATDDLNLANLQASSKHRAKRGMGKSLRDPCDVGHLQYGTLTSPYERMTHSEIEIDCSCTDILNVLESGDIRKEVLMEGNSQSNGKYGRGSSASSFEGELVGGYSVTPTPIRKNQNQDEQSIAE